MLEHVLGVNLIEDAASKGQRPIEIGYDVYAGLEDAIHVYEPLPSSRSTPDLKALHHQLL